MGNLESRNNRPRDAIANTEYTPLRKKDGSKSEFVPSISIVKGFLPEDTEAQLFAKKVSKVLRNQNRNKQKVSTKFTLPFHTKMETELVSQKRLADASRASGYNPKLKLMTNIALLLRRELEERYRNKPDLTVFRLGDVAIDKNGAREKLVVLTDEKKDLTERRFCSQLITENLPHQAHINPRDIQGEPGVIIGSVIEKDQKISEDDLEIIQPLISEVKPAELVMATTVVVHSGLGRSGIAVYPVEP